MKLLNFTVAENSNYKQRVLRRIILICGDQRSWITRILLVHEDINSCF